MKIPRFLQRKNWPLLAVLATAAVMVLQLRCQGRIWFCDCGQVRFWTSQADGPHTSQHLADPYSLTHLQHGLILFWLVGWLLPRWKLPWRLWLVLTIEAGWEVLENTAWIINHYRQATAAVGYTGDAVLNSAGDLLACGLGFYLARWAGRRGTWILFWSVECILLVAIRDSLVLSVLMLIMPVEAVKQWQLG